jgi:hypothetical protein
MKKKLVCFLTAALALLMSFSMFAGCGKKKGDAISIFVYGQSHELTIYKALINKFTEETGINVATEQLFTVSTPKRDPRGWTVSTCFMGLLPEIVAPKAGDDAVEARWFTIDYLASGDVYKLILRSDEILISCELKLARRQDGKIDVNKSEVLVHNGIAFDHAKLILYAVESL